MLRSAGARRLRKTLRRCPAGAKNSPENCLVDSWDVTHERALSPADLFGGKAPVGALIGPGANLLAHMQPKCILYVPL
jgi:hypothetical protein